MDLLFRKRRKKAQPACADLGPVTDELGVELAIKAFYIEREQGSEKSPAEFAQQFPAIEAMLLADLEFEESLITLNEAGLLDDSAVSGELSSLEPTLDQSDDSTVWPVVNDKVSDFTLVERIGVGKFSRVFAARSESTDETIAIKVCRKQGDHEARTLSKVVHRAIGIVEGVEQVPETDLVAIRMPLKSRTTLADVLSSFSVSGDVPEFANTVWEEVQSRNKLQVSTPAWAGKSYVAWVHGLMGTLAEALSAAHDQRTAHCDLKPSNVLVTAEGGPILIDFNLSVRWDVETSSPNIGGTLPYMAPEQIRAFDAKQRGDIGPRTDIYGLAATVYELLTGETPFRSQPDASVSEILKQRMKSPVAIRKMNPHVPRAFTAVIMDCLSFDPKRRPGSAAALVARLHQVSNLDEKPGPRRRVTATGVAAAAIVAFASAMTFAVAFPPSSQSSIPDLAISTTGGPVNVEADIVEMMNDGYDAFEAGDFETAANDFMDVLKLDSEHLGAVIGNARAQLKLGNFEASGLMVSYMPADDVPELHAIRGLCFAVTGNHLMATSYFRTAANGGLRNQQVLTNLGYSLCQNGQPAEAIETLEYVRQTNDDTAIATLLLARARSKLSSQNLTENFPHETLTGLIEECPASPARSVTAAIMYSSIASKSRSQGDDSAVSYWSQKAAAELHRGCELGVSPAFWDWIKHAMPDSASPPPGYNPNESVDPAEYRALYLLDPLVGTPFERYTQRDLAANQG